VTLYVRIVISGLIFSQFAKDNFMFLYCCYSENNFVLSSILVHGSL